MTCIFEQFQTEDGSLKRLVMLDLNPEPWAVGPLGISNRGGTKRAYVGENQQLATYQRAVKQEISQHGPVAVDEECEFLFFFWRRLDQYQTTSGRAHARHVADATNMQKALEDALQGVLITNDRNNRRVTSEVMKQTPDTDPGIIIIQRSYNPTIPMMTVGSRMFQRFLEMRRNAGTITLDNFF